MPYPAKLCIDKENSIAHLGDNESFRPGRSDPWRKESADSPSGDIGETIAVYLSKYNSKEELSVQMNDLDNWSP